MKHILLADDHAVTRRGVREILIDSYPSVEVTEVGDGRALVQALPDRPWSLVLLDVMMPHSDLVTTLTTIRGAHPVVPVLVLTAATEVEYAVASLRAGANGLIHKHRACDELIGAISIVAAGGQYLHPETAIAIATTFHAAKAERLDTKLSARERDIFTRIALGRTTKETAAALFLSEKTVATYVARIREKTGLSGRVEIARYALQHGIVE